MAISHKSGTIYRHLGYERVYLPLREVANTPFHFQGDNMSAVLMAVDHYLLL